MKSQEIHVNEITLNCNTVAVTSLMVLWQGMCMFAAVITTWEPPSRLASPSEGSQQLKVHRL